MNDDNLVVTMRGVSRTFGSGRTAVVAVHDVSCCVRPGDRIALVGPSGSGKSTLLFIMAGLDQPTHGQIAWPAIEPRPLRPGPISVVFQTANLVATLDAAENVALPLLLAGVPPDTAAEDTLEAMAAVGVADLASALPDELSGGQAQRVAIARAIVTRPRLLLADEPTGQLDHATAGTTITALLDATAHAGSALVVATHDRAITERLETIWRLDDGRLASIEAASWSR